MRLKCIGCEVLARPLYHYAAISPHAIDFSFFHRGLHNTPKELHASLQMQVNEVKSPPYDAIIFAYGLCGQALLDLRSETLPMVVPKAHDCITLFLGSRNRYKEEFNKIPGTYWYTQDFQERVNDSDSYLPLGSYELEITDETRKKYIQKYGEDNADYVLRILGEWQRHYHRAALIDLNLGDISKTEAFVKAQAQKNNWIYEKLEGRLELIKKLLFGEWDDDFLVIERGKTIKMSFDEEVMRFE